MIRLFPKTRCRLAQAPPSTGILYIFLIYFLLLFSELPIEQREALERNKEHLVETIDLQSVLRGLMKQAILTKTLNFEVIKKPANERVGKLLDILFYRGGNAFSALCRVLKHSGQQELSYFLMKESYRKDEEIYW